MSVEVRVRSVEEVCDRRMTRLVRNSRRGKLNMKFNELKKSNVQLSSELENVTIRLLEADMKSLELEDDLEQQKNATRVARAAEGAAYGRLRLAQAEAKHPAPAKLIFENRKLKTELAHLQRMINTRWRR